MIISSLFSGTVAKIGFRRSPIGVCLDSIRKNSDYVCKRLVFNEFGDPLKVLKLQEEQLPILKSNEVIVKFLVAPINPADINCVQGIYPVKPTLPGTAGFEGVGELVEVGSDVKDFTVGDRVIPNIATFGTWRTCGVVDPKFLLKVPQDVNVLEIAGILSNPSTAYRMLSDFVNLQSGDVIIQNAANSACGQNVIQLCRIRNIMSVNIVRDRPDISSLKTYLESLGANFVLTEGELRQTNIFKDKICPKPKLALNAVSGRSATEICRQLDNNGVMITYGGMSKEPVIIPVSNFIFKGLSCKGFWMTRWHKENINSIDRKSMLEHLTELMRTGKLKAPAHKLIPLSEYKEAFTNVGFTGVKCIFDFRLE